MCMAPLPPRSVCGHAARVSVEDRIGTGVARFWCRMMHHARLGTLRYPRRTSSPGYS